MTPKYYKLTIEIGRLTESGEFDLKILVINGSPRGERSNTLKVTNAFLDGMRTTAECDIEYLTIRNMRVEPCLGCFGCWTVSPGKCVIGDDMRGILAKMFAADLVVYSFPLFYYSLPAKLKALVERQLPTVAPFMTGQTTYLVNGGHPPRFRTHNRTLLISTCGFYPTDKSYNAVREQFKMICGDDGFDVLFLGEGELFSRAPAKRRCDARLEVIKKAGAEYGSLGYITPETREQATANIFPPNMYAAMADKGWGRSLEDYRENDEEMIARVEKEGKKIETVY